MATLTANGKRVGRPPRPVDEVELVRLAQEGWPVGQLQRHFGIRYDRVKELLRSYDIEPVRYAWGERHHRWKGGRYMEARTGYIKVTLPRQDPLREMCDRNRTTWEHRVVMARHLGRPLKSTDSVHHINGHRQDNRLENLQLRQGAHGAGAIFRCRDCGSCNVMSEEL